MTRAGPFQGEKQWGHYESHVTISHDGEAQVLQKWVPRCQKPPVRILREGEVAGAPESPPGPGGCHSPRPSKPPQHVGTVAPAGEVLTRSLACFHGQRAGWRLLCWSQAHPSLGSPNALGAHAGEPERASTNKLFLQVLFINVHQQKPACPGVSSRR